MIKKSRNAVNQHVDDKYKFTYGEQTPGVRAPAADTVAKQRDPLYLQPHTILITKVYATCK
ncbi:hypothetical protein AGNV_022 [Anticarsia gemmatalis nucleopolyhedrovirus]|uniref:Baculovirus repeated ORF n=1 Tax=Anticarsia gemmatalis multiple nucleopolyhedrovirus TaxID=268591 RepID=A0A0S3IUU8_9ABAC|nr:hypothetical protein AGNV_022 [Anticarsia gemmatalis nucleopolyhedrovirus]ABI13918.1 hypothetical protein AGNV_022 [Anticarsia gemmatalis multiple nucleopolyhedrovirus]ALR69829.1 hypothetical protein AGNV_022 [Anticarsia gemmatalis multiple nucleopolyhedrovirus]ALR69987.1 hypothetical protein AGNV_022 [Anticarsia gemmatalis multiple nucleopolyhedrovirus]ALR70144.1 hypothetical protein AGNV_022 [Anticarsia gemmatalis multiple nucleopolyhedrovirus]ALR70301.1 hypothetical protein AGNV_022 [Ant